MKRWLILLMLGAAPAIAHSWYPSECCSDADCEKLEAKDVTRDDTHWILPTGQRIPFDAARESLDDDFHWCRSFPRTPTMMVIQPYGKQPCFFVPKAKA